MPFVRKAFLPIAVIAGLACALGLAAFVETRNRDAAALCGGRRYELTRFPDGLSPYISLAAAGVQGEFLIDYGATRSSLSAGAFPGPAGSVRTASISLPSFEKGDFELRRYGLALQPGKGQLGVIGADFLSLLSAQFTGNAVYLSERACDSNALRARGLVPVDETGFFSSDPSTIAAGLPNVPVVYLRLGEVHAWAQIDTGYADTVYPRSVDINVALYDRFAASGVRLERLPDIGVWTCEGRESRRVYAVRDGALAIENEHGQPIAQTESFALIVKPANGCGGIGAMSAPAAQLGASFLKLFGAIVFDPKSGTVWFRGAEGKRGSAAGLADVR
ncbi:MAG TPA: hypothetical protein VKG91_03185 [Roseiarcus sp.]|nr:hypothetical protein [Roseiarcus sp.]